MTLEHAKGSRLLPVGNTRVTMIRGQSNLRQAQSGQKWPRLHNALHRQHVRQHERRRKRAMSASKVVAFQRNGPEDAR